LSDVMMPGLDGFALLRAIREDPGLRLIPVILLSARAGEESRIDGLEAGADDYLVKPFTAAELVARVMTHLRLARQRRDALELRDAFVGLVSHELRTPITTIYAAGRLFEKESVSAETRAALMADVVEESDRLRNLVEDLLTIARTDRGQLSLQADPVLLVRLAERVIANEGRRYASHRITIEPSYGVPTASADAVYVEHVIRNLVSNAVKYSPPGSDIRIILDGDASEARLRVLDEGAGVPEGDEDRLFNLYYRSPTTALEVPGAGIGLYVCRRIVEAMGGRVWMARRETGGSEFGFSLPAASEEALSVDG
jgi:signal transduction histidine kinase